ncbi:hypothetical protein E2C01_068564 [Portunus trituberculatus]|uniref:Uncharacterized protein n=1 Tax=Portunus trituberculatus TaxID=210409 RepID=A0A5B7HSB4_PORTR|nr:hypothetical protein [Portunus trituberculatus]
MSPVAPRYHQVCPCPWGDEEEERKAPRMGSNEVEVPRSGEEWDEASLWWVYVGTNVYLDNEDKKWIIMWKRNLG